MTTLRCQKPLIMFEKTTITILAAGFWVIFIKINIKMMMMMLMLLLKQ